MKQWNIIFFGNTGYSAIGLGIIHQNLKISTAVTKPDGLDRKGHPLPNRVKTYALRNNIPPIEAAKITPDITDQIAALHPDFFIVEDYGLILPKRLLTLPGYAPLNIHHSLLPKYRGPCPVPMTILGGEKYAGVTIIHMNDKVDAGDIYAQEKYLISPDDTSATLLTIPNEIGAKLAVDTVKNIASGSAVRNPQDHTKATFTHYMQKNDGYIDIVNPPPPNRLDLMIRAYHPWPGVWTRIKIMNKELRIKLLPGKYLQVEGKKPMTMKDFRSGYPELTEQISSIFTTQS